MSKIKTSVFLLPGQERAIEEIQNNDLFKIIDKKIVPCPKEIMVMVYLEYEDFREDS